ncbi:hypothetical protein [Pseudomonas tohonis]|uniref:hypothetical protein n=1 Tax=Pseudomonas tohonis TaxID=2725477 RepID=UPI001F4514FE|nr:hypothetical protein [Pseudomonas tohonis]
MIRRPQFDSFSMNPLTELHGVDSAHVFAWKLWYQREGRHFDNARRHPTYRLSVELAAMRFENANRGCGHRKGEMKSVINLSAVVHLFCAIGSVVVFCYGVSELIRIFGA